MNNNWAMSEIAEVATLLSDCSSTRMFVFTSRRVVEKIVAGCSGFATAKVSPELDSVKDENPLSWRLMFEKTL